MSCDVTGLNEDHEALPVSLFTHAVRDSASPRHLELFSNKVKTEKDNVTKLR